MMQGAKQSKMPLGLPPWAAEIKGGQFSSLVLDGGDLYMATINQRRLNDGRMVSLVTSVAIDNNGDGQDCLLASGMRSCLPKAGWRASRTSVQRQRLPKHGPAAQTTPGQLRLRRNAGRGRESGRYSGSLSPPSRWSTGARKSAITFRSRSTRDPLCSTTSSSEPRWAGW